MADPSTSPVADNDTRRRLPARWLFRRGATGRRLITLFVLAVAWEVYARFVDNDLVFPTLSSTVSALIQTCLSGELPARVANSLTVLALGYVLGVAVAAVLTGIAASTRFGNDLLAMLTGMFIPLPAIALLPMAMLWFGLGQPSLVFVIVHSVLWTVVLNTQSGFQAVSPALRMSGQNLGLRGPRLVAYILVPAAFPSILAGLKTGWAFAWRTLIAAELVFGASSRSGGLGWFIAEHKNQLEIDRVFAGLLTVILVGLTVEIGIFRSIERVTVIRWGMQH